MPLLFHLLTHIFPLYILIGMGYAGGRYLNFDRHTLANLALYFCVPVVVFGFVADIDLQPSYILLPVIVYVLSAIVAAAFLKIGGVLYKDNRANLLSMCASMGNTGYFGLPVAMLLFDKQWLGLYMFMLLGAIIFEATIGYYIAARGSFTVKDSFIKLAKFPSIYATALALAFNLAHIRPPELFFDYWAYFKGAYVILGMMIIGAALAGAKRITAPAQFVLLSFAGKFIAWPALTLGFIALDKAFFQLFGAEIYSLLFLISIVPPAANIAAFSAQMDLRPEKAATVVLIGTVFALFFIPFALGLTGM